MSLAGLMEVGQLWRASHAEDLQSAEVEASGYPELDSRLPGGGWLRGQLIELLYSGEGRGELRLLWPLLQRVSRADQRVFWIDPPHHPYPFALAQSGIPLSSQCIVRTGSRKERLWAIEQALKSGSTPLVLSWLDVRVSTAALRRLQLAAQSGGGLGWVMRPAQAREQSSPAGYRLLLDNRGGSTELTLLKRRGGWPLTAFPLALPTVP